MAATEESADPTFEAQSKPPPAEPKTAKPSLEPGKVPTREELERVPALDPAETPFPAIEQVTAALGKPELSGKVRRVQYRYGARAIGGDSVACETLDLVALPDGSVAFDDSVLTSPECKGLKGTEAKVRAAFDALGWNGEAIRDPTVGMVIEGLPKTKFDAASKAFEKQLGKPQAAGEVEAVGYRYTDELDRCRFLIVTTALLSGAGQALWGVPCE